MWAQRELQQIPDPNPAVSLASFTLPDGLQANLFAGDGQINKPIHMNFDARGRLWVAGSEVYPQIEPGQPATDKIYILEDTTGDGSADKVVVFADNLLIPTGILPDERGGCYVANSTELLYLWDSDGDGKADQRRIVLSGFGTEDTHHLLHTLTWAPDGSLFMNQSIYIHSHVETPWGVRRMNGGGVWRFRPDTMELEVHCLGFVNPWGKIFDDWGQSFATDGAYGEGINYVFPNAVFVTSPGATRIVGGMNPGSA
jgi:putative membrane-bound dehydrogenase-like protein